MTAITFMNNPNYVKDRSNILHNSELALQSLESNHLLSASQQANNAASTGQGNTAGDLQYTSDQNYNDAMTNAQDQAQQDLQKLYNEYLGGVTSLYKKTMGIINTVSEIYNIISSSWEQYS